MSETGSGGNRFTLAFRLEGGAALGPGRIALLEAIERTGSISGAARMVGMSYRKAWRLIDDMNRSFREPLVETAFGGARGGGARVTETGRQVGVLYRRMERTAVDANADSISELANLLAALPDADTD